MHSTEKLLEGLTDMDRFAFRLGKVSLSRRAQYVHALVRGAMSSQDRKNLLLSLSGPVAVEVVEEMQEVRSCFAWDWAAV